MAEANWISLLVSSVGGGLVVKLFDYLREEHRRHSERSESAKDLLTKHHDPILKAADELVGEIRSLSISDFADFRGAGGTHRTAEVTAVRVVDRTWQRAAGEAILLSEGSARRPMNLYEFTARYKSDEQFRTWFSPLALLLESTMKDRKSRQRVMKYGVVLLALIDTLDPKHILSARRDPWPNKLSNSVRKELLYGTFREHFPFVENPSTYFQPTKKRRPVGSLDPSTK